MHSHLITVEVCVECSTYERVNLDCLTFDELWFEGLDTETVQRRCAVKQHWMLGNNFFKNIPHHRSSTLDHALCRLDVLSVVKVNKTLHHEWFEEFKSHLLW